MSILSLFGFSGSGESTSMTMGVLPLRMWHLTSNISFPDSSISKMPVHFSFSFLRP